MATVVVTRATDDAGRLTSALRDAGHRVIEVPTIEIVDEPGGIEALQRALDRRPSWVVVTSRHGADRLARAAPERLFGRLAVVGSATAARCAELGLPVALVPERFVGDQLVATIGAGDGSTVVVAQAAGAAPTVVEGLRANGWTVEAVTTYRSIPAVARPEYALSVRDWEVITFTSGSTATNFVAAYGLGAVPPKVACIGPVTADVARGLGVQVDVVAEPHTIEGLVAAVSVLTA